ncbi:MAG: hypothetical protein F6J93_10135 [Oscillatoria sp. SIO1A7]|nr:hypothetical protein [Oscillatoria sp. SIO1A7]
MPPSPQVPNAQVPRSPCHLVPGRGMALDIEDKGNFLTLKTALTECYQEPRAQIPKSTNRLFYQCKVGRKNPCGAIAYTLH